MLLYAIRRANFDPHPNAFSGYLDRAGDWQEKRTPDCLFDDRHAADQAGRRAKADDRRHGIRCASYYLQSIPLRSVQEDEI